MLHNLITSVLCGVLWNQAVTSLCLVHGAILQQLPFRNICYVSWVLQAPCSGARVKPTTGEGSPLSWGFCSSGGNLELHLEMDVTHPGTLSPGPRRPGVGHTLTHKRRDSPLHKTGRQAGCWQTSLLGSPPLDMCALGPWPHSSKHQFSVHPRDLHPGGTHGSFSHRPVQPSTPRASSPSHCPPLSLVSEDKPGWQPLLLVYMAVSG